MILSCNSCGKKFVVPDQAITSAGRMVQCGSCGNKWKQYPTKSEKITPKEDKKPSLKKTSIKTKPPKPKKKITTKKREINLYSPEYLAKKHGISLKDEINKTPLKEKGSISFGFYSTLVTLIVIIIALSRVLYFIQDFIIQQFPFTEFYLNYFFESIRNMFEIWKNLISNY